MSRPRRRPVVRDGDVIGVEHADGSPPYRVRWSNTGHESLFFPGPDASVDFGHPRDRLENEPLPHGT